MQNKQKMGKRILLTISQDNSKLRLNFYFNRGNTVKKNNHQGKLLQSREAFWKKMFSGRSMIEMLAVLAIIGILSIASIVGFRYAMDKYKSNSIYSDVHLLALYVMDTGRDTLPADFYPDSGVAFSIDTNTYSNGFVVKAPDVSEDICERIMDVKDSSIEEVYVGSEGSTVCSGTQTIGFMFLYDGEYASGDDSSGNTGSGSGVTDPCEGIVVSTDCGISEDVKDENGCVLVQKISCSPGRYCLGQTCEPCPAADSCSGESCCALTGPDDVCGNPTKTLGTISTVTHSDLNSNGCCESTTCSLNPVTPRTCTPTCEGTCQSDGTCRPNCAVGESYNEEAGQCCEDITEEETDCRKLTPAMPGMCPHFEFVSTSGMPCMTEDGKSGTCNNGVCEAATSCEGGTIIIGIDNGHEYCMGPNMTWDEARVWCEERGRSAPSVGEMCPGMNAMPGEEACTNLSGIASDYCVWSGERFKIDPDYEYYQAYFICLSNGLYGYDTPGSTQGRAFCY